MQIIDVEQGSDAWLSARAGCITGTRLKSVMGRPDTRLKLIYELIGEKLAPLKQSYVSDSMERGHVVEEILKERFPEIKNVGMIKMDGCDWLGISPD